MSNVRIVFCCLVLVFGTSNLNADLVPGLISDFQDGTEQNWFGGTTTNIANSGPLGNGDFSLQLENGGSQGRFAMFNTEVNGIISPQSTAITVDIFRPAGQATGEIRLVLFDTGSTRWTSTNAAMVAGDGIWKKYTFSLLESDLTRVFGTNPFDDLTNNLERIMFRHDPGAPSAGGSALPGTMNFDNITAIPEPSACVGLMIGLATFSLRRKR